MEKLFFLRHGKESCEEAGFPLSEIGRQQAAEAAKKIGAEVAGVESSAIVILSSCEQRALQTAGIIAEALGVGEPGARAHGFEFLYGSIRNAAIECALKELGAEAARVVIVVSHMPAVEARLCGATMVRNGEVWVERGGARPERL